MFQTKVVEKIKTHFVFDDFLKIVPFMRQGGKIWWSQRGHRWLYDRADALCMQDK
jgi:hypothetical protein